jgi:putative phosphoesterase
MAAADMILHAGDFTTSEVLIDIEALGPPVAAVVGNVDEPALAAELPETRVVDADGVRIGMVHVPGPAAGRAERLAALFDGCHAVVYGHTHMPEVTRLESLWILNPGSPTERRRAPARSMLVLDIDGRRIRPRLIRFVT